MPLESRENYERLNEHLAEIESPVEAFTRRHDYLLTPRMRDGLYPRVSLTQNRAVTRSIQMTMDFDPHDQRFNHFFPEIPYTVFGAAWIDDLATLTRWHGANISIKGAPFCVLVPTLQLHLEHFHSYLSGITEEYIRASARTSPLSPLPPPSHT